MILYTQIAEDCTFGLCPTKGNTAPPPSDFFFILKSTFWKVFFEILRKSYLLDLFLSTPKKYKLEISKNDNNFIVQLFSLLFSLFNSLNNGKK